MPTALIQWHQITGERGAHIALLRSVSSYASCMGMPMLICDDLSFTYKGNVTCGVVGCANWLSINLHQIGASLYVPATQSIDAALATNPDMDLLGLFTKEEADVEYICVRKTIYLPAPYLRIFLECNLTPAEVWI